MDSYNFPQKLSQYDIFKSIDNLIYQNILLQIFQMLFLLHKPTNLLIQNHQKLIITTSHQLIFTSINFIQEYLTRKLVYPHPQNLTYSKQTSQAIIITNQSIQMYWTDWQVNIQLRCFISLIEEKVYSNIWDQSWKCYGYFQQYSTKNIRLVKIYNHQEEFSSCFLAELQIILTNKRLVGYNHQKKILRKIKWSNPVDRLFTGHPKMMATKHESGTIILSIDNICLHIHQQQVIFAKQHEGELYINTQTAIWINPGRDMIIYSIAEKELILLGQIQVFEGHYLNSTLNRDKLIIELQIKTVNLVDPQVNVQYENRKKEKERLRGQININREKQNQKADSIFNSSTTPELGNNLKGFLKTSISRFQEEINKSFQSRHFELKQSLKESQIVLASPKTQEQKPPNGQIELDSLGMVSEQLKEHSGLFEHAESGFEWQQLEKEHFEQNQDPSNIVKDLQIQQANEPNQLDFAETPAFNFQGNNPWGHYHQNWPESDVIREKSDSSRGQRHLSSQVSVKNGSEFDKDNSSFYSGSDNRKFTAILGQIYRKQPDKFDDALESCLQKLIHEDEARIFFADIIRIHNPDLTKDRLLRLYRLIPDTDENRRSMGKALSEFRLQQVPWACLAVKQAILKIYQKIYPTVYIQDLLNPKLLLLEQFIQSYFSQNYINEIIEIQDEKIQISHPRNLLNIILYLNDEYCFPLQRVFQIYTKKLIRHEKLSIIKKLSDSNVCQICLIDNKIFEKSSEQIVRQMLQEGIRNREHLQGVVNLMGGKKKRFYNEALALIDMLNQEGCKYNVGQLLDLPVNKNASNFFKAIIQENNAATLAKLNIPLIFKKLLNLQESNSMYYQVWQIEACKQISQILLQNHYHMQAIRLLLPIGVNIKRSFMAKILLKYFNGDYLQLLVSRNEPSKTVSSILQLIQNQQIPLTQSQSLQKDESKSQSWNQFKAICSKRLNNNQWQLFYLIYNDKMLAKQLVSEGILNQDDYEYLVSHLSNKKVNTIDWLNMNFTYKQIPLIVSSDSSENQRESKLQQLPFQEDYPKLLLQRSFKGYDSIKEIQSIKMAKSVRYEEQHTDPHLILLKLQVQNSAVLEMLRQIYQESPKDRFLLAVGMIDRQKITLNNIELFKSMINLKLSYPFEKLIPFDYFLDDELCWKEVSLRIRWELSWQNFWVIYTLVGMIYRRENDVAYMFIEKIIVYQLNDRSEQQLLDLLSIINLQSHHKKSLLELAFQRELEKIVQALKQY